MNKFLVYLAGPISGLNYAGATTWRKDVTAQLDILSGGRIECLSPMRAKDYLQNDSILKPLGYDGKVLSNQRGITGRDRYDCTRADLVFFNFLGATTISAGTCIEIGWADAARNPAVLVMEPEGSEPTNPHEHAMIRELCPFRVPTLEEACIVTARILLP